MRILDHYVALDSLHFPGLLYLQEDKIFIIWCLGDNMQILQAESVFKM